MEKDLVIGVTGAVLLVVAMIGVFAYESGRAADAETQYRIAFSTLEDRLAGGQGSAQEGECVPVPFEIPRGNITRITFTVQWTDDVGQPDTFNVTVTGPANVLGGTRQATYGGAGGTLNVPVHVANVPAGFDVPASTSEEAQRTAASNSTLRAGQGTWRADVCLTSAPGTNAPVAGLPPLEADGANGFRWSASFEYYTARATPVPQ